MSAMPAVFHYALLSCTLMVWASTADSALQAGSQKSPVEAFRSTDPEHWGETQQLLENWLKERPEDTEASFMLARVLAWQGKYQESLRVYQRLITQEPENSDYLIGLANLYAWQNNHTESIRLLEKAIRLAPDNPEAWTDLIKQLHLNNQNQDAERKLNEAERRFPGTNWIPLRNEIRPSQVPEHYLLEEEPDGLMSHVEVGGSYEALNHGYRDWSSSYIDGNHQFASGEKIYGRVSDLNRFGVTDATLMGGFVKTFGEKWMTTFETQESPTGHFSPQWSMYGAVRYQFDIPVGLEFGYKYSSYRTVNNDIGTVVLEGYVGNWRLASTLYVSQLEGAPGPTFSGLADIAYYYDDKSFFGTMLGYGKQVIVKSPGEYENSNTQTYMLRGQHFFSPNWAFVYDAGVNVQGITYTLYGANMGVRYVF